MISQAPIIALPIKDSNFNRDAVIPHGCTIEHIRLAMDEFIQFLTFIDGQLLAKELDKLELFLMPANFSSIVGEFMASTLPKYCSGLVRNTYHNGHPDLVPTGFYPNNSILHGDSGIEIKASRHLKGWQGHNAEKTWLLVFCFDANSPRDIQFGIPDKPFKFAAVYGAQLDVQDWTFSGRSATSRRTITASINNSGYAKMSGNWIYRDF